MNRFGILKTLFAIFLVLIVLRLFYWQVLKSDELTALADEQHLKNNQIDAPRGNIMSSDGSILATNKVTYELFGLPKVIKDKGTVADELTQILVKNEQDKLEVDYKTKYQDFKRSIFEKLSQDLFWVSLAKNLDTETKLKIDDLHIDGLGFNESLSRFYPEASMSAHILGFVAANQVGTETGYFGIEGFYNRELKGTPGNLVEEKDAQGLPILTGRFFEKEPIPGYDIKLNIDRSVQYLVESKLKEGVVKYGAKFASAIIIEPATGSVIAAASLPNYDPNHFVDFQKDSFKNPLVAGSYEPGSTFKVLVMGAGINEDVVKPDTICDICSGPVALGGFLIRTWNNQYKADSTMTEVIIHSDNTGMVFVSRKLGLERMQKYIEDFGFGNSTGVDLQDESSPDIRPKKDWKEIDLATASFGQGIAVTPIQMVRAISAIANGGKLMELHVANTIYSNNKIIEIKPKVVGLPISEKAAKEVTEMMIQAVDKGESQFYKKRAGVADYKIAGKTGTAQIPVAGHYDPTKTVASFVGFAPADKPRFVMLVKYDEPTASIFGAETAAPTFFEIAKELFLYYGIGPNE